MRDRVADPTFHRAVVAAIAAAVSISTVVFLVHGAGYVLDDWFTLRNAHFGGAWAAAGSAQAAARPGSYPISALVFGVFGQHPVPGVVLLAAINATTAVLTFRLVGRFFPRGPAALAAVLWVVLPTHTSTELWLSGTLLATSQLALTAALLLAVQEKCGTVHMTLSCALLAAAVLAYEASLPMAALGALVLPVLAHRRLDVRFLVGAAVACGAPALWLVTHWYSGKSVRPTIDPIRLVQANLGWGVTPGGPSSPLATPLVLVVLCGVVVALVRATLSSFEASPCDWMVIWGVLAMIVGVLPFIRYYYEPQGAGDRANYLSAVGGALVWAGLAWMLARADRRLAGVAVLALLALAIPARYERIRVWSTAGHDAQAIADAVVAQIPNPGGTVVVGPSPILRWNVGAYVDDSNLTGALSIAYGIPHADVRLSRGSTDWAGTDVDLRFDSRDVSELDDLPVH